MSALKENLSSISLSLKLIVIIVFVFIIYQKKNQTTNRQSGKNVIFYDMIIISLGHRHRLHHHLLDLSHHHQNLVK